MYKETPNRTNSIVRALRIMKYLKRHSNKDKMLTQNDLRNSDELADVLGTKNTFNSTIKLLDEGLNTDFNDSYYLDEADWRLVVEGLRLDNEKETGRLRGIYYNHPFSHDEMDLLLEGIWSLRTISTDKAQRLTKKLENELTDKSYSEKNKLRYTALVKMQEKYIGIESLKDNLRLIQEAIKERKQLEFTFNSWHAEDKPKKIRFGPTETNPHTISPYYIVVNNEKYYLLAGKEPYDTDSAMMIWRIDLMSDITITKDPVTPKHKVRNLPTEWIDSSDFHVEHLNMAYDTPRDITMKISSTTGEKKPINYNFLFDTFGDKFEVLRVDDTDYYGHIIKVKVSPFAVENWALSYSTRVEILDPPEVRASMKEKISMLNRKYKLSEEKK